jgi:hypothetical protein
VIGFSASVSITHPEYDRPLAAWRFLASGVIAMFEGRLPPGTVPMLCSVAVSMAEAVASLPLEMNMRLPSAPGSHFQ